MLVSNACCYCLLDSAWCQSLKYFTFSGRKLFLPTVSVQKLRNCRKEFSLVLQKLHKLYHCSPKLNQSGQFVNRSLGLSNVSVTKVKTSVIFMQDSLKT